MTDIIVGCGEVDKVWESGRIQNANETDSHKQRTDLEMEQDSFESLQIPVHSHVRYSIYPQKTLRAILAPEC
ncbi:heat shock protein [Pseudozyma hubeiensis SY62]|uniref:Heat shock protein n=1 Tax=Pseudozyma hubeiensis (strain SY62) TaxID=1305764 RepID=R9P052_PSEHS|nr:heat shock protein [Pseudozyma hubeiensis SY62]GAC94449.1 heat shock protein [Pseudozyma hubeiensis SY62]